LALGFSLSLIYGAKAPCPINLKCELLMNDAYRTIKRVLKFKNDNNQIERIKKQITDIEINLIEIYLLISTPISSLWKCKF